MNNEKNGQTCFGQFDPIDCICIACIYRAQCMKKTSNRNKKAQQLPGDTK